MASLFQSKSGQTNTGRVQIVDLGVGSAPGILSVSGRGGKVSRQSGVIITSIGVDQSVNAQFMASLQKVIYVYSFGDRMGAIRVNGICFDRICGANTHNQGTRNILDYYDDNRAIDESRIMKILIGKYSMQGYLVSLNLNTSSAEFKTTGFALKIITIPKQVGLTS